MSNNADKIDVSGLEPQGPESNALVAEDGVVAGWAIPAIMPLSREDWKAHAGICAYVLVDEETHAAWLADEEGTADCHALTEHPGIEAFQPGCACKVELHGKNNMVIDWDDMVERHGPPTKKAVLLKVTREELVAIRAIATCSQLPGVLTPKAAALASRIMNEGPEAYPGVVATIQSWMIDEHVSAGGQHGHA